jgi:ascorbate-specific PTS system EIIC-type component UlaA
MRSETKTNQPKSSKFHRDRRIKQTEEMCVLFFFFLYIQFQKKKKEKIEKAQKMTRWNLISTSNLPNFVFSPVLFFSPILSTP